MIIIDVRDKDEFDDGHVEGAINIPAQEFMRPNLPADLKNIAKEQHIIVYCASGNRAASVHNALYRHGFLHVENGINRNQTQNRIKR